MLPIRSTHAARADNPTGPAALAEGRLEPLDARASDGYRSDRSSVGHRADAGTEMRRALQRTQGDVSAAQWRPVPKHAHYVWLHKTVKKLAGSGRTVNNEEIAKVVRFSADNPGWKVHFWTNDVQRLQSAFEKYRRLGNGCANAIHFHDWQEIYTPDRPSIAESKIDEYMNAVGRYVPAFAKDVFVPLLLSRHPGIYSDVDIEWRGAIADGATVPNAINLPRALTDELTHDINAVVYAPLPDETASGPMHRVINEMATQIDECFTRNELSNGMIHLEAKDGFVEDDTHFQIGVAPMLDAVDTNVGDRFADTCLPFAPSASKMGWDEEQKCIARLIAPKRLKRKYADESFQPQTKRARLPKQAHAVWLHKEGAADMPLELQQNVLNFAKLNPWNVILWTDDTKRLQPIAEKAENLSVRNVFTDAPISRFPVVNEFARAAARIFPECAKDLFSYQIVDQHPGLFFDVDIPWSEEIPGEISPKDGEILMQVDENQLFAYSGKSTSSKNSESPFDGIFKSAEMIINEEFERTESKYSSIIFTLKSGGTFTDQEIINRVGFNSFMEGTHAAESDIDIVTGAMVPRAETQWEQRGKIVRGVYSIPSDIAPTPDLLRFRAELDERCKAPETEPEEASFSEP